MQGTTGSRDTLDFEPQDGGVVVGNINSTSEHTQEQTSTATLSQMFAQVEGRFTLDKKAEHKHVSGTLRDGRFWEIQKFTSTRTADGEPFTWYNAYLHHDDGQTASHAVFLQGGSISQTRRLAVEEDGLSASRRHKYTDQGRDKETDWHTILSVINHDLAQQAPVRAAAQQEEPPTLTERLRAGLHDVLSAEPALAEA